MTKSVSRATLACATVALLALGTTARAEEGVAIKNMLGSMGIIPKDKDTIRYRERAPLVLPPKMELREPASPETYASNNPQWPKDPDIVARRARAAEQAKPVTESEVRRMSENNPRLTIYEMRQGRSPNGGGGPGSNKSDREGVWVSPAELAAGGQVPQNDREDASGTPVRRTLTDPPTSFRQAARGGKIEGSFDVKPDQQAIDANPINWLTRKFSGGDDED